MKAHVRALTPAPLPEGEGRTSGADPLSLREKVTSDSWPDEGAAAIDALDWPALERELAAYGCAIAPRLISPKTCGELAALYPDDARFRSRIVMGRMALAAASTNISPTRCPS